jgi:predicted 3-demethylubiquinone-9 3-methyltransferase (glyoxalase superfamily)
LLTGTQSNIPLDVEAEHGPNESGREGTVKHAQFALAGGKFMVMDGPGEHAFGFNEAVSLMISCETQDEIDYYWARLIENGGAESRCGWLKDPFGVSWQVVPAGLREIFSGPNAAAAMQALLGMRKLDIEGLKNAS